MPIKRCVGFGVLVLTTGMACAGVQTDKEKLSYAMGFETGRAMKARQIEVDPNAFVEGMKEGVAGKPTQMKEEEIVKALSDFHDARQQANMAKSMADAEKNQKAGEAFLADNRTKKGVVETASGLQYKVIDAGKGKSPSKSSTVTVNYEGKLLSGKVFDSSYKRKQPASFGVSQVIAGWTEALSLMQPGATWELYIPAKLAYGEHGIPGVIGPNEVLIFKVQLIAVD